MWVFLVIISVLSIYLYYLYKQEKNNHIRIVEKNIITERENKILEKNNKELYEQHEHIREQINQSNNILVQKTEEMDRILKQQKGIANQAFEDFQKSLEQEYEKEKEQYDKKKELLKNDYSNKEDNLLQELDKIKDELDKWKKTRAAAIQADLREKEMSADISYYCIPINDVDKIDIQKLNQVAKTLTKPRILYMLIWQTYFQKPLKTLSANILGTETVTGIYRITNTITNECYIGQAADMAARWAEHCKCGLGIDTPASNKLYKSMQEYNLWNFSFELLEKCSREELNEKERFYIGLYDSYNFGFNSNTGIKGK